MFDVLGKAGGAEATWAVLDGLAGATALEHEFSSTAALPIGTGFPVDRRGVIFGIPLCVCHIGRL
jgi:hypothetical protein